MGHSLCTVLQTLASLETWLTLPKGHPLISTEVRAGTAAQREGIRVGWHLLCSEGASIPTVSLTLPSKVTAAHTLRVSGV